MVGTVREIQRARGFFFVRAEVGSIFGHAKEMRGATIEALTVGQAVTFDLGYDEHDRPRAFNVRLINGTEGH